MSPGHRVVVAQNTLADCAHGHESLVEDAVARAKQFATGTVAVGHPAEPPLLTCIKTKAYINARYASERQLVMINVVTSAKNSHPAAKRFKPGDVWLCPVLSFPLSFPVEGGMG